MSDSKKEVAEELSLNEMDKVTGGKSGRIDVVVDWENWPKCDDAYSSACPGSPICARFGTPDCIQGHYNPEK